MNRRLVLAGVAGSALQVVLTAVVTFASYRLVRETVGAERFGVWAAVGAVALASGVAELGMGSGALRYISLHLGRSEDQEAREVAETAVLSSVVLVALAALALGPVLPLLLTAVWNPSSTALLPDAAALLPWVLGLLVVNALQNACLSCLDGAQRVHVRNALAVGGSLIGLAFAFAWVPERGLIGYAQALGTQALVVSAAAWTGLRWALPGLPVVPCRWRASAFRRIVGYGAAWQGISLVNLLTDPLAKILLGRYGGLALLGQYEAATKLALPLRGVVVSAQQALVPAIARMSGGASERLSAVYVTTLRVSVALVGLTLPALLLGAPLAAVAWLGGRDLVFERLYALLTAAWFFNALSGPAYFDHVGRGRLMPVFAGHATTALGVVVLGPVFAHLGVAAAGAPGGGFGVAVAAALSIGLGSSVAPIVLHRGGAVSNAWTSADRLVGAVVAVSLATAILVAVIGVGSLPLRMVTAAGTMAITGAALAVHPDVRSLRLRLLSPTPSP